MGIPNVSATLIVTLWEASQHQKRVSSGEKRVGIFLLGHDDQQCLGSSQSRRRRGRGIPRSDTLGCARVSKILHQTHIIPLKFEKNWVQLNVSTILLVELSKYIIPSIIWREKWGPISVDYFPRSVKDHRHIIPLKFEKNRVLSVDYLPFDLCTPQLVLFAVALVVAAGRPRVSCQAEK